jgi:hypothetical protein
MFTTSRNSQGLLLWLLLAAVTFVAATLTLVYSRPRPPEAFTSQFPVLRPSRLTRDFATRRSLTASTDDQLMTLDPTGKFLINPATNKPVFITGEDAWSLQGQLSDADIEFYLSDRASRGFNLIWVGLADNFYSNHPPTDFYGNAPFGGMDFTNETEAYWSRVDHTLLSAAAHGITVMAAPAFVGYGCKGGYCASYRSSSTSTVAAYGRFLGNRYKGFPNIIWLIGGDADPADTNVQSKLAALANGIRSEDNVHLMTTENYRGTSSADIWSRTSWLDLDGLYLKPAEIPAKASSDYRAARYPVFLMEDWYEGEHSTTELEIRREGYWAVLSGCTLGRIFGNYAIWNFGWPPSTTDSWRNQVGSTGSTGQTRLGTLFRSREHWRLVPDIDHAVMVAGYGSGSDLSVAARTSDGQTIIAYVPNGDAATITINMSEITDASSQARCWWFNPRNGSPSLIGSLETIGTHNFTPPDGEDWVLVIDSLTANLAAPGSRDL